jgi:poly(3-hydroxybutyrate) depolymerase
MLVAWLLVGLVGCAGEKPAATPASTAPNPGAATRREGKAKQRKPDGDDEPAGRARGDAGARKYATKGELPKPAAPCQPWADPGLYEFTLPFDGQGTRTLVYVPGKAGPHPTAVLLHGGTGDSDTILEQTDFLGIAEEDNVVVIAPSGAGGATDGKANWNMRDNPGAVRDDVKYLDALSKTLRERTCGGPDLLVVGFSNGSMMAQRWLCQGDEPDAALTAAGRLPVDPSTCKGPRPIRSYVGTDDDQYRTGAPTSRDSLDLWAKINRCKLPAKEARTGDITRRTWDGCQADTQQAVLEGYPHAFPRGRDAPVDAVLEGWPWFLGAVKK